MDAVGRDVGGDRDTILPEEKEEEKQEQKEDPQKKAERQDLDCYTDEKGGQYWCVGSKHLYV
jgi:hypothetical protein